MPIWADAEYCWSAERTFCFRLSNMLDRKCDSASKSRRPITSLHVGSNRATSWRNWKCDLAASSVEQEFPTITRQKVRNKSHTMNPNDQESRFISSDKVTQPGNFSDEQLDAMQPFFSKYLRRLEELLDELKAKAIENPLDSALSNIRGSMKQEEVLISQWRERLNKYDQDWAREVEKILVLLEDRYRKASDAIVSAKLTREGDEWKQ